MGIMEKVRAYKVAGGLEPNYKLLSPHVGETEQVASRLPVQP